MISCFFDLTRRKASSSSSSNDRTTPAAWSKVITIVGRIWKEDLDRQLREECGIHFGFLRRQVAFDGDSFSVHDEHAWKQRLRYESMRGSN